ncbi:MAG: argininosuccinate synthase, partial [Planctomycetota bacterium]
RIVSDLYVENLLLGKKYGVVLDTQGGLCQLVVLFGELELCIERDLYHQKLQLAHRYAELTYNGQWFHPLREALQAFMDYANQTVTGEVTVKLYKGSALAIKADAPKTSLYDEDLASFAMDGYDITAARGFIDLYGLPMQVRGLKHKPKL